MFTGAIKRIILVSTLSAILLSAGPQPVVNAHALEEQRQLEQRILAIMPLTIQMLDNAIARLSNGRSNLTPGEQAVFNLIFDPANSGEIDEKYVKEVLDNMRRIRHALRPAFRIRFSPAESSCTGERLYYTDLFRVYVCPYFDIEQSDIRKARGLVHEIAHMALFVVDRPYFVPGSEAYTNLTPRGSWTAQLPTIGRILREVNRGDTLYHPDAYAHLAAALSGVPGELALYLRFLPGTGGSQTPWPVHIVPHH